MYASPPVAPPAPIDSLVDEGALIVASGIRMAVKNLAILWIFRDGGTFTVDWYLDRVREQLAIITTEKADDATRADEELRRSHATSIGAVRDRPEEGEVERLERRKEMLDGLVDRLRHLSSDDAYVSATAFASRDAAWGEISASIEAAALRRVAPTTLDAAERKAALSGLRSDLQKMERDRG